MKTYERKTYPRLARSPFSFTLDGVTYFFATERHMQKFMDSYKQNRNDVSINLTKRWRMPMRLDLLADLYLYSRVENRGFHIIYKGKVITWQGAIELSGLTMTTKD